MFADESVHYVDPTTGMSALHIAVGRNWLHTVKSLVAAGAKFFPDKEGRWPSTIAALMEVDDDLLDFVAEQEEKALAGQAPEDV